MPSIEALADHVAIERWAGDGLDARTSAAGRLVLVSAVAGVALAMVQGFLHLLNIYVLDWAVPELNADADSSLAGWLGTAGTGAAALAAAAVAAVKCGRRWPLGGASVILAYLSVDDMLALHERITLEGNQLGPIDHAARLVWPLIYLPALAAVFCLLWFSVALAPRPLILGMRGGLMMLALAIVLEASSPLLFMAGFDHGYLVYETEVVLEEGLESAGWLIVAGTLLAALMVVEPVDPQRFPGSSPVRRRRGAPGDQGKSANRRRP